MMKRLILIIIPVVLVVVVGLVIFGVIRSKHNREVAMSEFLLCEAQFKEGKYKEAEKLLETFVNKRGRSEKIADANYYLAISLEKLGEKPKALTIWNKIIDKYPKSQGIAEAYYYSGASYHESGQADKATEYYNTILNKFPDSPVVAGALYGLGKIYESQGKKTEAMDAYQKVIDKYPGSEFIVDSERRWSNICFNKFIDENAINYEVKKGDSPIIIGSKFSIAAGLVKKLNNLTSDSLQVGQTLKLIKPDFNILVDLSKYKLYLKSGDKIVKIYTVATGKKETPTPTGEYKVTDKLIKPTWYQTLPSGVKQIIPGGDPKNELGTRWIGFKPAYGIHGTIEPLLIGQPVSHGCIRMLNEEVEELYDLISGGTPIKIIG
jgi:lipoprotein-anchoring transpeptidase ErfK/SrfK/outer membrane protein assembly factor BamD (BamD/ComL family)